jgi:hypothetical protein
LATRIGVMRFDRAASGVQRMLKYHSSCVANEDVEIGWQILEQ